MSSVANKRYCYSSKLVDLSVLPLNVFKMKGDAFYKLVEDLTSEDIEDLLKIQRISSARSFLNTNPLAFFDLKSDNESIIELQNRLSYKTTDHKIIILAGIDGDILYLKQLFESFLLKNKTTNPVNSTTTDDMPPLNTTSTITQISAFIDQSESIQLSIVEHRKHLIKQIDAWWEKHRNEYDLQDNADVLTEFEDYELIIDDNSAVVKCSCNQKINLPTVKGRNHYQLSYFYKYLTYNDQCTILKRKCVKSVPDVDNDDEDNNEVSTMPFSSPVSSSSRRSAIPKITTATNNQPLKRSSNSSSKSLSQEKRHRRKR